MICEAAMTRSAHYVTLRDKFKDGWRNRALSLKAISFGLVGVVNTGVDYSVFLLARAVLSRSPAALAAFGVLARSCHCSNTTTISLIVANMMSWMVAVTGSYIMNSSFTFAVESGRKLHWRAYLTFVVASIAGWLANTVALVVAAEVLLLPIWAAKAVAVSASFVVNFSLSHFVVFQVRAKPGSDAHRGRVNLSNGG